MARYRIPREARFAVFFRGGRTAHAVYDPQATYGWFSPICGRPEPKDVGQVYWRTERRSAVTCKRCLDSLESGRTTWKVEP